MVQERQAIWTSEPSLALLRDYVRDLSSYGRMAPAFDPTDAGTEARVLFVLEAPRRRADVVTGSGFLSADNDDQTAANVWHARKETGLVDRCLHTNIVPHYLGAASVKPNLIELAEGALHLRRLIALLPKLAVVVLCGDYARQGWRRHIAGLFEGPGPVVIETHHPSPQGLIRSGRREHFVTALRQAAAIVTLNPDGGNELGQ